MKHTVLILICILTAAISNAQTTVLTGQVADSLTLAGEPGAVILISGKDPQTGYTSTDEEGRFIYSLKGRGSFTLQISNMGRKTRTIDFTASRQDTIDFGRILLQDDVQMLKAGSVTAQKTLVKMELDKVTYKVEDDIDAKTSTVLDMLRKVPMVVVDGQDNITVNGSGSFLVYVDSKPNPMMSSNPSQVFKSLPASFVRSIEVITSPGARYDAEGVGGVLNLTTAADRTGGKSVADGQYGNAGATVTTRGAGANAFYSFQKGKWAMSLNGSAMYNVNRDTYREVERTHMSPDGEAASVTESETDINIPMYMGNMSLSYEIDSLNLVSASAGWMHFGMISDGTSRMSMHSQSADSGYDGTTFNRNTRNNISATLDYQHSWAENPARALVFSYQFSGHPSSNDTYNTYGNVSGMELGMTGRRSDAFTNSMTHTAQTDFTTPLSSEKHKLSIGIKFISRRNSSDQKDYIDTGNGFVYDDGGSLRYAFINNIGSAYAEYDGKLGRMSAKAGLRYEHTWQNVRYSAGDGDNFHMDYGNLVPNAGIQYAISQSQNIGLSYSMRISRPGITYLNPYVDVSDPTARTYGNTSLKTESAHSLNLAYNLFSPKWIVNLTLHDTYSGNGIAQYSFFDGDGLLNTTYGNIVQSNNIGLSTFLTWIPGQKTRLIFNGGTGYSTFSSPELKQSNSGWSYNAMVGYQQTLPLDIRLSANLIATGHSVSLQGWHSGIVMGMLGVTRSFLEDRLTLSLNGVTHLTGGRGMKQVTWSEGSDFTNKVTSVIPMRTATFNISYAFGRQDSAKVKKTGRGIRNDAELNSRSMAESLGTMGGM